MNDDDNVVVVQLAVRNSRGGGAPTTRLPGACSGSFSSSGLIGATATHTGPDDDDDDYVDDTAIPRSRRAQCRQHRVWPNGQPVLVTTSELAGNSFPLIADVRDTSVDVFSTSAMSYDGTSVGGPGLRRALLVSANGVSGTRRHRAGFAHPPVLATTRGSCGAGFTRTRTGCGVDGCGCGVRSPDPSETRAMPYWWQGSLWVTNAIVGTILDMRDTNWRYDSYRPGQCH